jgi:hypothetical protein
MIASGCSFNLINLSTTFGGGYEGLAALKVTEKVDKKVA